MNTNYITLLNEVDQYLVKINEEYKKKNTPLKESLCNAIKMITSLKQDKDIELLKIQQNLSILILPIQKIINEKMNKMYFTSLSIIKAFVANSIIPITLSGNIISLLKDLFFLSNECHFKILEILVSMVSNCLISIEEDIINKLMIIALKIFSMKNNDFKNPLKSLFVSILKIVYNPIQEKIDVTKLSESDYNELANTSNFKSGLSLFKSLIEIAEGKNKEWIASSLYSKCLAYELISEILVNNANVFIHLIPMNIFANNDLVKALKKQLESSNDYLLALKLFRCAVILIKKIHLGYELIPYMIHFAEHKDISWVKWLGLECLGSILGDHDVVTHLATEMNYHDHILTSLSKVSRMNNLMMNDSLNVSRRRSNSKITMIKKAIENDTIVFEGESAPNITLAMISQYIFECFDNYKNSLVVILDLKGVSIGAPSKINTEDKDYLQLLLSFKAELIADTIFENLEKINDDALIQSYLSLLQHFISIYGTIYLDTKRDYFIKGLCRLSIPNNIQILSDLSEKEFLIIRALFNVSSCVNLLSYNSWILLIEPLQQIDSLLERKRDTWNGNEDSYNVNHLIQNIEINMKLLSTATSSNEIQEILNEKEKAFNKNNDLQKSITTTCNSSNNGKNIIKTIEENDDMFIISSSVDRWLIDSSNYNKETVYTILKAFHHNCQELYENNSAQTITFLKFNLRKLLEVSWANYSRMDYIWEVIINIIEIIAKPDNPSIYSFCMDILSKIIINTILKYEVNPNANEEWNELQCERTLISSLMNFATKVTTEELCLCFIRNLSEILKKCVSKMGILGWSSLIENYSFVLSNSIDKHTETAFEIIQIMLNDYSSYINPYNITPILSILEIFSSNQMVEPICMMAILYFKTCGKITENYQNGKSNMTRSEEKFFNEFLPDSDVKTAFYNEIWRNIFNKLTKINLDQRYNVRKASISVFTELFNTKINNIAPQSCEMIINDVFAGIFKRNTGLYKENIIKSTSEKSLCEWEDTAKYSLQEYTKVLKTYLTYNTTTEDKRNKFIINYIEDLIEILTFCRPDYVILINESILEVNKTLNVLIMDNIDSYWKLLDKFKEYFTNDCFIKKYGNVEIASLMLNDIICNVNTIFQSFISSCDFTNKSELINLNRFISYYHSLISSIGVIHKEKIDICPDKLINSEVDIFQFFDNIAKESQSMILVTATYNFFFNYLEYNNKIDHSEATCKRSLQSLCMFYSHPIFPYQEYVSKFLEKAKELIELRHSISQAQCLMKHKRKNNSSSISNLPNNSDENKYLWSFVSSNLLNTIKGIIQTLKDDNIWQMILSYIETVFTQNEQCFKQFPRNYQDDLIKSSQDLEIETTNFIIEEFISKTYFISKEIQLKFIGLIAVSASIDYNAIPNISGQICKNSISNLIELCKYRSDEEIKKEKANWSDDDAQKYLQIRIKIAKMCTPILIQRCGEIMKKFLSDEIKNGSMPLGKVKIEEIKFILENMQNLEIYPHYTIIDDETRLPDEDGLEDQTTVMGVVSRTKKAHLFQLHPILSEFITTKENDIKILIKEIFRRISKEMGIKSVLH